MSSNFGVAVGVLLKRHKVTQSAISKAAKIKQPSLNAIINDGNRPKPATLASLVAYKFEDDAAAGVSLLIEHLRDEIDRAELHKSHPKAKILISTHDTDNAAGHMTAALERISRHQSRELIQLINDLCDLLDAQNGYAELKAAEDRPEYGKNKNKQS